MPFDVAANPEFLKEGAAIKDFMSPDRVVVGVESERARRLLSRLYRPFLINNFRVLFMDIASAEMTKYAANAMLATRISFMNDIANLCDRVGADVEMVRKGIGSDARIGTKFLYPGCGYGGSCFPKDVKALARTGREYGSPMRIVEAVDRERGAEKRSCTTSCGGASRGRSKADRSAVGSGPSKPETDDVRESPALVTVRLPARSGRRGAGVRPRGDGDGTPAARRRGDLCPHDLRCRRRGRTQSPLMTGMEAVPHAPRGRG